METVGGSTAEEHRLPAQVLMADGQESSAEGFDQGDETAAVEGPFLCERNGRGGEKGRRRFEG